LVWFFFFVFFWGVSSKIPPPPPPPPNAVDMPQAIQQMSNTQVAIVEIEWPPFPVKADTMGKLTGV
jgi:hypothetical protein